MTPKNKRILEGLKRLNKQMDVSHLAAQMCSSREWATEYAKELIALRARVKELEAEGAPKLLPLECVECGEASGPLHPEGEDHPGWMCEKCYNVCPNCGGACFIKGDGGGRFRCPDCGGIGKRV